MDTEQTFIRVQERLSQMLTPRIRAALEYIYLFLAITFFCILVVMHANYVQQPGCSSELAGFEATEAQLIQIKITSAGLWSQKLPHYDVINVPVKETEAQNLKVEDSNGLGILAEKLWFNWLGSGTKKGKLDFEIWDTDDENFGAGSEGSPDTETSKPAVGGGVLKFKKEESQFRFPSFVRESFKAVIARIYRRWYGRLSFCWRHATRILGALWDIAGIHLNLDVPKWLRILQLERLNSYAVQWLERKSNAFEPTYLYTMEKGFFLLPEGARLRHNIRTVNISISARHPCFRNRWQQLMINRLVGYDTILMNSLLSYPGKGYLYNYQTKEFYNITYAHEQPDGSTKFGDYLVNKCGVLMMSLFVFFTTTMSVSFTLRETQTRMLKFTVQLQHHARHRLPTFQLIFVHVIESLVFVPIMIGILFFLFEFYDDQLLAFMVLILVWLCELFTLISVRTPISMKFFPRFFLLYFLVFHIYFFSYTYGFSYLALSTTAAFMQHLILYFWNHFEVPALQRFVQNRRSQFQQHPDFHITSSTILASTLHITRLNTTRNTVLGEPNPVTPPVNSNDRGPEPETGTNPAPAPAPGHNMSSFSSLLLRVLGGASSEGLNSFFSMFRDMREQGGQQLYQETPQQATQDAQ